MNILKIRFVENYVSYTHTGWSCNHSSVIIGGGWFYVKIWEKGLVQYLFIRDFDFKKIDLEVLPGIFKFDQFRIEEEQVVERGF